MTLTVLVTYFISELQMYKSSALPTQSRTGDTPKDILATTGSALHRAANHLARIHEGIPGQCIPREVMDFYKAIKGGDRYRPRMVKEAVLGIKEDTGLGIDDRATLAVRHRNRMVKLAKTRSQRFLEKWLQARPTRQRVIFGQAGSDLEHQRTAYVMEAMDVFEDTFDYIESLAAYGWGGSKSS